ncbi:3-isopropylmalate dehydratase small subunit [Alicyclobacillus sp. ALC3]|uniref:3-isopropylmalate dehydratase small subunit n=1 Tax=Alicyclobacillus sp. ALC3 TaxID=2796143 RepID=UPI002377F969|nr:3-isopropylmalate dehydratase small subunit [Alicyclobacillus sp. ALC3]WDL97708.1 3-isopropylmalate dehydratase small subunit [Alicyclobacillus sp. ALC3]
MTESGRVWKYGDNLDTDVIIPGRYLKFSVPDLVQHAMEGVDPDFGKRVQAGDFIVAGKNFGCGSSRETAPGVLKGAGIAAVIAPFFARIFYRNAINFGLPVLECAECLEIEQGDRLIVHLEDGVIEDVTQQKNYGFQPFPPTVMEILQAGGLVSALEKRFLGGGASHE